MLNTNCGVIQSRKRSDYHRRRSKLHVYGKTAPARQCKVDFFFIYTYMRERQITITNIKDNGV